MFNFFYAKVTILKSTNCEIFNLLIHVVKMLYNLGHTVYSIPFTRVHLELLKTNLCNILNTEACIASNKIIRKKLSQVDV